MKITFRRRNVNNEDQEAMQTADKHWTPIK